MRADLSKLSEHYGKDVKYIIVENGVINVHFDTERYLSDKDTLSERELKGILNETTTSSEKRL